MNIGINAQLLNTGSTYRSSGVSKYSENLLHYMDRLLLEEAGRPNLSLTAYTNTAEVDLRAITLCSTRLPLHNPIARIAWEQAMLPLLLRQQGAELIHGLVNVLPLTTNIPGVVTVHDLSFLRFPELLPRFKATYLAQLCRASVRRAHRVIAVSQQTADDVMHFFDTPAAKIDVVYNGVGEQFVPVEEIQQQAQFTSPAEFRQRHALPAEFILYLGTLEPRKNLERLIGGYAEWRNRADADPAIKLVIAGAKGWYYSQIFERVNALGLSEDVIFPGYIADEELPNWYRAATCFVYPSLFEGFGMPVAEAMACGAPVLVSRANSLLEVVGEAGITFETKDATDLAAKLSTLLADPQLRPEVSQRCLARSKRFSWSRAAQETVAVYERALQ